MPTRSTDRTAPQGDTAAALDAMLADPNDTRTLGELIDGLNAVGQETIPYSRLPTRARTAYAGDLTRWADIADLTVADLLARPIAGISTVRALLHSAHDAAQQRHTPADATTAGQAAAALLAQLSERERIMLTHLVWGAPRRTAADTATRLGLSVWQLRRQFPRARAQLDELLATSTHQQVHAHADELRRALGPYLPVSAAAQALQDRGVDPDSAGAGLLLHLAGPYTEDDGWMDNPALGGAAHAAAALDRLFARRPAPTPAQLTRALTAAGMPAAVAPTYLDTRTDLRRIGGVYVQWGTHAVHHVEAVLHARRAPASITDIRAAIGADRIAAETIRPILQSYPQFLRATRTRWALRSWGLPEYRGIFTEIAVRLDAAGGAVATADLVADLTSRFPDIAESSIYANLDVLAFVHRGGIVRRRTDDDPWPTPRDTFSSVRGAFRRGRHEIRWAIPVDADVLRGSGRPIPPAVTIALGIQPGEHRLYTTAHGQTPVTWRLESTHGPSLGSTQALATATGARLGDTLVLVFGLAGDTLDGVRIPARTPALPRLARLLGRDTLARTVLAASLDCRPDDIEAVLTKRGESALARAAKHLPDRLPR